jgi:hypothetical protein
MFLEIVCLFALNVRTGLVTGPHPDEMDLTKSNELIDFP